jgi:hypothetical protein
VYPSPQQSAGDEVLDGRCDQYSLGAVTYEALAGVAVHRPQRLRQFQRRSGALSVAACRSPLTFPSWITPAELARDPVWPPLRTHPGSRRSRRPTP